MYEDIATALDEAGKDDTYKLGLLLLCVFLHNRSRWSLLLLFPAGLLVVLMFDVRHLRESEKFKKRFSFQTSPDRHLLLRWPGKP